MHRDISIGNVLKLKTPAERKEFSIKNAKDLVEALTTGSNRDDYHRAVVEKADVLRKAKGSKWVDRANACRRQENSNRSRKSGESCQATESGVQVQSDRIRRRSCCFYTILFPGRARK